MLGDLGADVVKVEAPNGDPLRRTGAIRDNHTFVWSLANRNKRSVVVDFDADDGLAFVHQLTAVADVVVLNQPRALLERWGCTYEAIAARNPCAIVVLVSGYGADGPYADRAGAGTILEAFGGLTHMTGEREGPPMLSSVPIGDYLGAQSGLQGVLAALYWRDAQGGAGQFVDATMFEAVMQFLGPAMIAWSSEEPVPTRRGSRLPIATPRNVYQTGDDRWVALSGPTDPQVSRMLDLLGITGEARVPFAAAARRNDPANANELDRLVADWIARHEVADVIETMLAARIPIAEVNDVASLLGNEHVQARASIATVDDPFLGPLILPAPAPHLSATPMQITSPGPTLGTDEAVVRRDWLGES